MNKADSYNNKRRLMILAFSMMLTIGIVNNLRGQIGPLIIDDFGLSYSQLGFLFSFLSIGPILVFFFSGKLIEKFGLLKVLVYGLIHTALSLFAVHISPGYYYLLISFFFVSLGLTLLNIVSVTIISLGYSNQRGKMINLLHLFYGLGGIIAPYFVTLLIRWGFGWSHSFLFSIIFITIVFVEFKNSKLPETRASKSSSVLKTAELLKDKVVILFCVVVFVQVGVEISIVTWLAPYLKDVQGRSELVISFFLSLFFITFTVGRLLASLIVEKIGYYNFLLYTQVLTALSILLALVFGTPLTFLLSISGIFIAVQVPTSQAAILDSFGASGIKVVGFAQTAGTIGAAVLSNWVVGFINDFLGIRTGFIFLILLLIILFIITIYLKNLTLSDQLNPQEN